MCGVDVDNNWVSFFNYYLLSHRKPFNYYRLTHDNQANQRRHCDDDNDIDDKFIDYKKRSMFERSERKKKISSSAAVHWIEPPLFNPIIFKQMDYYYYSLSNDQSVGDNGVFIEGLHFFSLFNGWQCARHSPFCFFPEYRTLDIHLNELRKKPSFGSEKNGHPTTTMLHIFFFSGRTRTIHLLSSSPNTFFSSYFFGQHIL